MRKFPREEFAKTGIPVARIRAMINDLSPEALCSLLCLLPRLEAKFRELLIDEYDDSNVQAVFIIEAWESDDE